jgi:hypothetical protein
LDPALPVRPVPVDRPAQALLEAHLGGEPEQLLGPLRVQRAPGLAVGLLFVGGGTGSTAGGLKVSRLALLARVVDREFKRMVERRGVFSVRLGGEVIPESTIQSLLNLVYLAVVSFASCLALAAMGLAGRSIIVPRRLASRCGSSAGSPSGPASRSHDPLGPAQHALGNPHGVRMILGRHLLPDTRVPSFDRVRCERRRLLDLHGERNAGSLHQSQKLRHGVRLREGLAAVQEDRLERLLDRLLRVEAEIFVEHVG